MFNSFTELVGYFAIIIAVGWLLNKVWKPKTRLEHKLFYFVAMVLISLVISLGNQIFTSTQKPIYQATALPNPTQAPMPDRALTTEAEGMTEMQTAIANAQNSNALKDCISWNQVTSA